MQRLIDPAVTPIYRHLLVSSPFGAGKTGLAAGISTEFAFRMSIGRYTTLVKLLESNERSVDRSGQEFQDGRMLWPWRNAELLVIDDVDTVGDMLVGRVTPGVSAGSAAAQVGAALGTMLDADFKAAFSGRRSVCIIGDTDPAPWMAMLRAVFGLQVDAVGAVSLIAPMPPLVEAQVEPRLPAVRPRPTVPACRHGRERKR